MRKPFYTFISDSGSFRSSVFYSGAFNGMIKNMLLRNVRDLFQEQQDDLNVTRKVYSMSEEFLSMLSEISKKEKRKEGCPVLFNLYRGTGGYHLYLGIAMCESEAKEMDGLLRKLKNQPSDDTRKKVLDKIRNEHSGDNRLSNVITLISSAMKSNRTFTYHIDAVSDNEKFVTMIFEVENKNDGK